MIRTGTADHGRTGGPSAGAVQSPRLVVMGRQGSGKGTQCARLATILDVAHIDVGDALRSEVHRRTPLGQAAERYVQEGRLLPDEMVTDVVLGQLGWAGSRGFILDGFPRTLPQAESLGDTVGAEGIDLVVNLAITPAAALRRLTTRRVCAHCGSVTTIATGMLSCSCCEGPLVRREDDTEFAIKRRLVTYERQTRPVLEWYAVQGRLVTIDGGLGPDTVTRQVLGTVAGVERVVARPVSQADVRHLPSDLGKRSLAVAPM